MKLTDEAVLRRLAVVLRDSNDAITVQDLKGQIIAWNRGAERMYSYTEKEALSMNISQLVPRDKKEETLNYLRDIARGIIVESFETQRIDRNGKILDVWLVITCLKDDEGAIDSIATTERDITDLKRELRMLRGMLPICASCKNIRDDEGYWHQIESYVRNHSEADFSHSICPECAKRLYPEHNPNTK